MKKKPLHWETLQGAAVGLEKEIAFSPSLKKSFKCIVLGITF